MSERATSTSANACKLRKKASVCVARLEISRDKNEKREEETNVGKIEHLCFNKTFPVFSFVIFAVNYKYNSKLKVIKPEVFSFVLNALLLLIVSYIT